MLSELTKITFIFCFVVIMSFFFSSSNSFSHNLLNSSFQNFRILSVLVILCLMLCAVVKSLIFCHRLHVYSVLCLYSAYFHTWYNLSTLHANQRNKCFCSFCFSIARCWSLQCENRWQSTLNDLTSVGRCFESCIASLLLHW